MDRKRKQVLEREAKKIKDEIHAERLSKAIVLLRRIAKRLGVK